MTMSYCIKTDESRPIADQRPASFVTDVHEELGIGISDDLLTEVQQLKLMLSLLTHVQVAEALSEVREVPYVPRQLRVCALREEDEE